VPADDASYLKMLEGEDDVTGNGIFDGPQRRPISYPDAAIFSNNWMLPGYIDRAKSFANSEVRDVTTGVPVVYVPGGAVSIDDNAKVAFLTGKSHMPYRSYLPPSHNLRSVPIDAVAVTSSAITALEAAIQAPNVQNNLAPAVAPAAPLVGIEGSTSTMTMALLAAAVGFGVGWMLSPKKARSAP
jgi:hypothetical protein